MSKSHVKYTVAQITGTFENKEGDKKNNYQNLGVVIENEKGHLNMKLNALPLCDKNGEVWVKLFEFTPKKSK